MFPLSDSSLIIPGAKQTYQLPVMLIVGDPAHMNIAHEALVELELGWEVIFAKSAFEILDIPSLREIDLVLVDLDLPQLDGVEIVEELHQHFPRLPIVLMSAPYGVNVALEGMRKGACNHFPRDLMELEPTAVLDSLRSIVRERRRQRHTMQRLSTMQLDFTLTNDRALIVGVVQRIKEAVIEVGICDHLSATRLGVAVEEAILNAIIHGNLEITSDSRQNDEAIYNSLIEARRQQAPFSARKVQVTARLNRDEAVFVITDEGPGFDIKSIPDPTTPIGVTSVSGRGILLMRSFMNTVQFNDRGNAVTLIKKRR
jgi:FixJ family two-component response regulator